jgi:hypothetical protein
VGGSGDKSRVNPRSLGFAAWLVQESVPKKALRLISLAGGVIAPLSAAALITTIRWLGVLGILDLKP